MKNFLNLITTIFFTVFCLISAVALIVLYLYIVIRIVFFFYTL